MKYLIVIVFILSSFKSARQVTALSDTFYVDPRVDSLFTLNFTKMNRAITTKRLDDSYVDRKFVILLTYLSGIQYDTSDYSGFAYFSSKTLEKWEVWYKENKHKIVWEKVNIGLFLLKKNLRSEEDFKELRSLLIHE
jgi:hypothetical protein